jgi:hypothetical protein
MRLSCPLQNERGISALGVAVGFNRVPFVELLLDAGADLALNDSQGNTVLHYAAGEVGWRAAMLLLFVMLRLACVVPVSTCSTAMQADAHLSSLHQQCSSMQFCCNMVYRCIPPCVCVATRC